MNRSKSELLTNKIDKLNSVFIGDNDENVLRFDDSLSFEQFTLIEHSYSKPKKAFKLSKKLKKVKDRIKNKLLKNKKNSDKKHKKKKFRQQIDHISVSVVGGGGGVKCLEERKINVETKTAPTTTTTNEKQNLLENSQNISIAAAAITDNSIIMNETDLSSGMNSEANISASGRVDFSGGRLNITNVQDDSKSKRDEQQPPPVKKAKKSDNKTKLIIVESSSSSRIKKEENIPVKDDEEMDDESISDKIDADDNDGESSNNEENDSNFDSDDDPEKLWCICRQPYDDRFMIGCDLCEEWFHGKCMEKLGEDWYCPSCREDLNNKGIPKEELKVHKIAEKKALERVEKEKRLEKKRKNLSKKPRVRKDSSSKHSSAHDDDEDDDDGDDGDDSSEKQQTKSTKSRHISRSNSSRIESMKEKEEEEKRRLKKLIKASKKDLNEKREKLKSNNEQTTTSNHVPESTLEMKDDHHVNNNDNGQHDTSNSSTSFTNNTNSLNSETEFSKVFTKQQQQQSKQTNDNNINSLNKKKHKIDPIDQSVQDLFKAEPSTVLMRSLSSSSSTSINTTASNATNNNNNNNIAVNNTNNQLSPILQQQQQQQQQQQRKTTIDSRRTSTSSSSTTSSSLSLLNDNIICPNNNHCGGTKINIQKNEQHMKSIYCNQDCIQTHVTEMLKTLRSLKRMKEKTTTTTMPIQSSSLKIILIDRLNNDRKDNIQDKDVLDFILKNQTYEIYKPSALRKSSNSGVTTTTTSAANKTTSSSSSPPTKSLSTSKFSSLNETTSSNNKTKQSSSSSSTTHRLERTSSISSDTSNDNKNESRRQYVRNTINEILKSRYKEMTIDEKATISSFSEITKLSLHIENELFKVFKAVNSKYQTKSRSLIFNLRDTKNTLYRKVLLGKVSPERLVNMTPEELASAELSRWREHEKKTMIQLITRDAFDQANQVIVKKTHKGEEFIENDLVLDLPTSSSSDIIANNQKATLNDSNQTDNELNMSNLLESPVKDSTILQDNNDSSVLDLLDTTSQHSTHVYSSNCKICIQNSTTESNKLPSSFEKDNISNTTTTVAAMMPPTSPVAKIKQEIDSSPPVVQRLQPKRVRVENESFNEFLKEAEKKLSDKILMEIQQSSTINSIDTQSSDNNDNNKDKSITTNDMNKTKSLTKQSSKEISRDKNSETNGNKHSANEHSSSNNNNNNNNKTTKPVWKGTIFHARCGPHDYVDQITVCGRIAPEQALDYIEKLKISKHSEIVLMKFVWSSREERTGYDAFFNYLTTRNRLGVVYIKHSNNGYKDFYILPLSQNSDIPEILLPSNNSVNLIGEIGRKNHRPNLLLGILIKSRKSNNNNSQLPSNISQSTQQNDSPSVNERSYTPPLSSNTTSTTTTPPFTDPDDGSYTPPPLLHSTPKISDGTKKIGQQQHHYHQRSDNKVSIINAKHDLKSSTKSSNHDEEKLSDMIEKVSSSSNPIEMTASILNAIVETGNIELQGKLLCKLQAKVEDKLQHTIQTQNTNNEQNVSSHTNVEKATTTTTTPTTTSMPSNIIPASTSSISLSFDNLIPNIKNIQLPDNLKDILRNVQEKTTQVADAQRIMMDGGGGGGGNNNTPYIIDSSNVDAKNIPQNNVSFNDPRLRQSVSSQPVAASMSKDELLQKAQEQMAALAQMEYHHQQQNPIVNQSQQTMNRQESMMMTGVPSRIQAGYHQQTTNVDHSPGMSNRKISFQWKKKK
ncbi:Death-inducer obliterator 1 [Dermatophagoides farinae]|uniref:Death-inducer obliterator 1 n=1 Tax=Dermatophagoides farinae TaxID=6954 RepID=A0A922HMW8_DERFA|nr:Death-inducer obliterator 1 [Dermatophagoides farinae]